MGGQVVLSGDTLLLGLGFLCRQSCLLPTCLSFLLPYAMLPLPCRSCCLEPGQYLR